MDVVCVVNSMIGNRRLNESRLSGPKDSGRRCCTFEGEPFKLSSACYLNAWVRILGRVASVGIELSWNLCVLSVGPF